MAAYRIQDVLLHKQEHTQLSDNVRHPFGRSDKGDIDNVRSIILVIDA